MRANKPLRSESASEVERLQRELRRFTTEHDILKKRSATLQATRSEARLYRSPSGLMDHACDVPCDECLGQRVLRMVRQACQRAQPGRCKAHTQHSRELRAQRPDLRQPAGEHDLRGAGEQGGINRVARLMRLVNLQARRRRHRFPADSATRL
jgi:hypothetical protein